MVLLHLVTDIVTEPPSFQVFAGLMVCLRLAAPCHCPTTVSLESECRTVPSRTKSEPGSVH